MADTSGLALLAACGVLGASCGGSGKHIEIRPVPDRMTKGSLEGPLCKHDECTCRSGPDDGGAGFPDGSRKRYEVRLGSPYELWVSFPDRTLYKNKEKPLACFYVDLAPGEHAVELRASNPNGLAATLEIKELGAQTKSWYETFRFNCGNPGACSFEELEIQKANYDQEVKKHLMDPCGSTKIKNVIWDTGKSPDQQYPSELVLQMVLDIYKFAPKKPTGDPTCGPGEGKSRDDEAPPAQEPAPTPTPTPAP